MSKFVTTGQDWATVSLGGPRPGSTNKPAPRLQSGESKFSQRAGPHQSTGGRTINQQGSTATAHHKKLDEDTENYRHQTVSHNLSLTLQRARQQKGLSQKELAHLCQEREAIIKEYENGKAIPNNQVIAKMERKLMIHLRGKDAGKAIEPKVPKSAKAAAKPAGKKSKA